MNAVLMLPETKSDTTAPSQKLLLQRLHNEQGPQEKSSPPKRGQDLLHSEVLSPFRGTLRAAILIALGAGALTLLFFSLVPAVFVGLLLFLPALAPIILVGLAIVLTGDIQHSQDKQADAAEQPCSCHHDRLQRALQHG